MDNRVRRENGMADSNNRRSGVLSPTGTSTDDDPLLGGGTPAEGQPGEPSRTTFRRWSRGAGGGDTAGSGRGGYGRDQGFGGSEYGRGRSGMDERESWRERDTPAWGRDEQNENRGYQAQRGEGWGGRDTARGREISAWGRDEQNEGRSYPPSGGSERGRDDRDRERERSEGRRPRAWWQRETLTVRDVMTTNVKSVTPDATARDIAEIMKQEDVGVVPVVRPDGRLVGLVTDRDMVIRGLAGGRSLNEARAEELATTDIEVIAPEDRLSDAIDLMGQQQVRRVPVVDDDDRLVGIIAMADIARHADYHEDLQDALEKISGRRSFWSRIWR